MRNDIIKLKKLSVELSNLQVQVDPTADNPSITTAFGIAAVALSLVEAIIVNDASERDHAIELVKTALESGKLATPMIDVRLERLLEVEAE